MLLSTVFILSPQHDGSIPKTNGYGVYAAFLDLLGQGDAALASELHAAGRGKPFTVSQLHGGASQPRHSLLLLRGHEYWIRFTSLEPAVSDCLLSVIERGVSRLKLFRVNFDVRQIHITANSHPWAGQTTYEQLYAGEGRTSNTSRDLALAFFSPTTFVRTSSDTNGRKHVYHFPFPLPSLVFHSLGETWQTHAPAPLGNAIHNLLDTLADDIGPQGNRGPWSRLDEVISVSQYKLRTARFRLKQGPPPNRHYLDLKGCTGEVAFSASDSLDNRWVRCLRLLVDFAFYAGVGARTTMGMGQVRRRE